MMTRHFIASIVLAGAMAFQTGVCRSATNDDNYVNFSFDQVDVRSFVKLVGDMTGKKFVVGDSVAGKITVVSPRLRKSEIYPLFVSILESVGCSVVEESGISRIIQSATRVTPAAPVIGSNEKTPATGLITKVIRLGTASAAEMKKVLESKVGGGKQGAIGAIEETNHLIVTDTADAVRQIEKIVEEVDQPGMARTAELVTLKYAGAEDLAGQLNAAMAEGDTRAERLRSQLPPVPGTIEQRKRAAVVVAAPHSNSLIIVGSSAQVIELKRIITAIDVDMPSGRGRLNAIFLKYITAEEAAKSINALLTKSTEKDKAGETVRKISVWPRNSPNKYRFQFGCY